jgi:addiction module HigA family antidote
MHQPPHPGEFLAQTYIEPLGYSLRQIAEKLGVSPSAFTRLVNSKADLSPVMAIRLSKAFGRTPESWIQMQSNYNLWKARSEVNLDEVSVIYENAS